MIPHFGLASPAGTAARIASTACPNCAGKALWSKLLLLMVNAMEDCGVRVYVVERDDI